MSPKMNKQLSITLLLPFSVLKHNHMIIIDFYSVLRRFSTQMFINIISLSRWNANRCYSLLYL